MADNVFRIKRGDRFPLLTGYAADRSVGTPLDCASAPYPRFLMRASGTASPIISATLGATVINASQGELGYVWQGGDTAATGGVIHYQGEFELTFPAGAQTVPTNDYIPITINLDIG